MTFQRILESISDYLGISSTKKKMPMGVMAMAPQSLLLMVVAINGTNAPAKEKEKLQDLGHHTAKWDYYNKDGNMIACVYRYDTPNGKEFRPWDILNRKTKAPEIRPLYRIPEILRSKYYYSCRGRESVFDALHKVGLTATTAMNGAKAPLDKTDWSPLGR